MHRIDIIVFFNIIAVNVLIEILPQITPIICILQTHRDLGDIVLLTHRGIGDIG
jgi:hypothetical protein